MHTSIVLPLYCSGHSQYLVFVVQGTTYSVNSKPATAFMDIQTRKIIHFASTLEETPILIKITTTAEMIYLLNFERKNVHA